MPALTTGRSAVPLSEHEQRLFDEIEKSLADDPKFASAVRANDPRHHARRRLILAGIVLLVGIGVLVLGVAKQNTLIGVAGFVIMLGAALLGLQSQRKVGRGPHLRVVGGNARAAGARRPRRHGGSIVDRLEERWRRRPEGNR
jgi:hypothetical protein